MSIVVGNLAPGFGLPDGDGEPIHLRDFRGRLNVVLAFYPYDWSPVCSLQLPTYQKDLGSFVAAETQVLGISRDSSYSHAAFAKRLGLSFPLLSDRRGEVSAAYGVLHANGSSDRAVFLIDKAGVVRFKEAVDASQQPDYDELLIAIEQLMVNR